MAFDLNQVKLIGVLTQDPECRFLSNGDPITDFNLNVVRKYGTGDSAGQSSEFFKVLCERKNIAEAVYTELKRGNLVMVLGRFHPDLPHLPEEAEASEGIIAHEVILLAPEQASGGLVNHLNSITFSGRLGRDPEIRDAKGKRVANFGVAIGGRWKDKEGNERGENTIWFQCNTWRESFIDLAEKMLKKGMEVLVEGELKLRIYTGHDGVQKSSTEVRVNSLKILTWLPTTTPNAPKPARQSNSGKPTQPPEGEATHRRKYSSLEFDDKDIPF